jgi:hypothetical protein
MNKPGRKLQHWFGRWQKCVVAKGKYFEGGVQ